MTTVCCIHGVDVNDVCLYCPACSHGIDRKAGCSRCHSELMLNVGLGKPVDMVNDPPHYKRGGMEVVDIIEAFGLNWRLGNACKYLLRAGYKGDKVEDLEKALWCIKREIDKS